MAKTDTVNDFRGFSRCPSIFHNKNSESGKLPQQRDCAVGGTHSTRITEWCLIKERLLSSPRALLLSIDSDPR